MEPSKLMGISTAMLAFSTFFGIMIASIYYIYQIKHMGFIEAFIYAIIYIDINLLFLYYIKRRLQ